MSFNTQRIIYFKNTNQINQVLFIFTFLLCSLYSQIEIFGQSDSLYHDPNLIMKNPQGTEFFLCFQKNYKEPKVASEFDRLFLELFITGNDDASVTIRIEGLNYVHNVFVPGKTVKNIKLPAAAQILSEEIIEKLAVHIVSDVPISVYGLNRRRQTTDTYLGLPTNVLGKEYRAMCYTVSEGLMPQFAIVATEDNTNITITPTVNTTKFPANFPYTIKMNKGEVYQVVANHERLSDCDLTGSLIVADKDIAVFSGHQCAYVTPRIIACNHLIEQMPPISSWGKHFYLGKLQPRSNYTFRVLANEHNTNIFEDSKLVRTLKAGEFYENTVTENIQITANKPVLVAQYSQGFRNGDSIGDPMMLMISPTQQFLKHYRFATPINGSWKHYINVVVPRNSIGTMRLNGVAIDSNIFEPLGLSRYSIAYIRVPFGTHVIEGKEPFGMYSYGFGYDADAFDAYGNMGGQSFLEYVPQKDILAPMAEVLYSSENIGIVFRDDRIEDTGLKQIKVLQANGLRAIIPRIEEGAPQKVVEVRPENFGNIGLVVLEATDVAGNNAVFSVCYSFDIKTNSFVYYLNEGLVEDCEPDPGFIVGAYLRFSGLAHSVDFSKTGNLVADGKFSNDFASGGILGLLFGRPINQELMFTARLTLETYGGSLEAIGRVDSIREANTMDLIPMQEAKYLDIDGYFLNFSAVAEYMLSNNLYAFAGAAFTFNLIDNIVVTDRILMPAGYVYENGSNERIAPDSPKKLGSFSALNLSVLAGLGFNYPLNYRYSIFSEFLYQLPLTSILSDATYKIHHFSLQAGIRMKF